MKIYLAGKVSDESGAWRDALLERRPGDADGKVWHLTLDGETTEPSPIRNDVALPVVLPWPIKHHRIFQRHSYTGPYLQYAGDYWKNLGEAHGVATDGQHGMICDDMAYRRIIARCENAIRASDMVFAYINEPDSYGTIAEIGYAVALGIFTAVFVEDRSLFHCMDSWFVEHMSHWHGRWVRPVGSERDRELEALHVANALKDAVVSYVAFQEYSQPVALVQPSTNTLDDAARSFQQIARWSSDPRVRDEAQRMLKRLA